MLKFVGQHFIFKAFSTTYLARRLNFIQKCEVGIDDTKALVSSIPTSHFWMKLRRLARYVVENALKMKCWPTNFNINPLAKCWRCLCSKRWNSSITKKSFQF